MSALNLSIYGYGRNTTPNFKRFAERAVVYHKHYASGNFTSPGTSSLLTGLYPWTHRAFHYGSLIADKFIPHNIYSLLGDQYFRLGFSQNPWVDLLLRQFTLNVDQRIPSDAFNLASRWHYSGLFENDAEFAYKSVDDFLLRFDQPSGSSLLALIQKLAVMSGKSKIDQTYRDQYPYGLPYVFNGNSDLPTFTHEQLFEGVRGLIETLPTNSTFAYFHLYPPHGPCYPSREFAEIYADDGFSTPAKSLHPLGGQMSEDDTAYQRRFYDQYIAQTDHAFGDLLDFMDRSGVLDSSYVILTSDHGNLNERGTAGHLTPLMFDPLIRIPLLISSPGQHKRIDVNAPTSAVDVLPTLLHLAGRPSSDQTEGELLPEFGGTSSSDRIVYSVEAKKNSAFMELTQYSIAVIRDRYKLLRYRYPEYEADELYDIESDPEEMQDLSQQKSSMLVEMKNLLDDKLVNLNQNYLR